METLDANIFCLYELFLYACFCRDEGNPTYEYYFVPNLFNGTMAIALYKTMTQTYWNIGRRIVEEG